MIINYLRNEEDILIEGNIKMSINDNLEIIEENKEIDNSAEILWNEMYELAKAYYAKNKHLNMPLSYKTKDGIVEDPEGLKLGLWVFYQQRNYNLLSVYKILCLKNLGLFKNMRQDSEIKEEICIELGITNISCIDVINRTPLDELIAKINYLLENSKIIVLNDKLDDIFYISNVDLEEKYGFNLETLINTYYHQGFNLTRSGE